MKRVFVLGILTLLCLPAVALAQESPTQETVPSRLWLVIGGVAGTVHGDCQECEEQFPYHHSVGLVGNIGYRVNPRMDVGFDMFYMPFETTTGRIQGAHLDAVAQFRPWSGHGFFVKGGAGMAFIQNWAETTSIAPINSKALSVVVGGGWAFRRESRVVRARRDALRRAARGGARRSAAGSHLDRRRDGKLVGDRWRVGDSLAATTGFATR